jgi:cell wall-associated NlpC family hydrolase
MTIKTSAIALIFAASTIFSAYAQRPSAREHSNNDEVASVVNTENLWIHSADELANKMMDSNDDNDQITADLLGFAGKLKGTRYRSGGKTPAGFDCSGFTGYVFRQFGYNLGASSRDQYNNGCSVMRADIRPGDLLFFGGRAHSAGRIGHVAIVVEANPETGDISFIHSASSGGVKISRLSEPYYAARYIGARRVIGVE